MPFSTGEISVGYEFAMYRTSERNGSVNLSITVSNPPSVGAPRPFSLSVSTRGRTAGILYYHLYNILANVYCI